MLVRLSIENYILINHLELEFSRGFSVITGETGAGKSIFLGALGLILGQRADTGVLLDKSRKCVVEGLFVVKAYDLESFFRKNELDYDEQAIVRREIAPNGKSRAFINDTPVNLQIIKELGDKLVNIHSQNSITTLNDVAFQLAVLDSFCGTFSKVKTFRTEYLNLTRLRRKSEELVAQATRYREEYDYLQFHYSELERAELKNGEMEVLEERLHVLIHAEEIKTSLFRVCQILSGNENNIIQQFAEIIGILTSVSRFSTDIKLILERLDINYIDIKDINTELSAIEERIAHNQQEMDVLSNRLDQINRLLKKHNKVLVDDLLKLKDDIALRLTNTLSLDEKIVSTEREVNELVNKLLKAATEISHERNRSIPEFEEEVLSTINRLGMPYAQFKVENVAGVELTQDGLDRVRFIFSANKGIDLQDISKIASGGELSRLMLSIKSMISQKNLLPTIFFDEIDSGVSGEIAGRVGAILKDMAEKMQVIVITHLPQIAAKAENHFWVYKQETDNTTTSFIKLLSRKERIEEIAKMLSDEKVTSSAYENAKELLGF